MPLAIDSLWFGWTEEAILTWFVWSFEAHG